jgi:hypothetical protein
VTKHLPCENRKGGPHKLARPQCKRGIQDVRMTVYYPAPHPSMAQTDNFYLCMDCAKRAKTLGESKGYRIELTYIH